MNVQFIYYTRQFYQRFHNFSRISIRSQCGFFHNSLALHQKGHRRFCSQKLTEEDKFKIITALQTDNTPSATFVRHCFEKFNELPSCIVPE